MFLAGYFQNCHLQIDQISFIPELKLAAVANSHMTAYYRSSQIDLCISQSNCNLHNRKGINKEDNPCKTEAQDDPKSIT